MSGAIVAGAAVRPVYARDGRRIEGPDEDAFTLAAAAIEDLLGAPSAGSLHRVELVGAFSGDVDAALGELLDAPTIEIRHRPPTFEGFGQALESAAAAVAHGPVAVVAADTVAELPGPSRGRGALATALRIEDAPGARVLGSSSRTHPPERFPVAAEWIAAAARATRDPSPSAAGVLSLVAPGAAPVLIAEWRRAFPSMRPTFEPWEPDDGAGVGPATRAALAVRSALASAGPGEIALVAGVRSDRTDFVALAHDAPVRWVGAWTDLGPSVPASPPTPPADRPELDARSEGAYVPRARYLENLPSRWRFAADRCGACGAITFPVRGRCRACGATEGLSRIELPRAGLTVEAVTTIAPGAQPTEFDPDVAARGPYSVVLARWPNGPRATLQVTDAVAGSVRIGDAVATRLRRLYPMDGSWRYGRKAVPVPPVAPTASG